MSNKEQMGFITSLKDIGYYQQILKSKIHYISIKRRITKEDNECKMLDLNQGLANLLSH